MTQSKLMLRLICASMLLSASALAEEKIKLDPITVTTNGRELPVIHSFNPASEPARTYTDGGDYLRSLPGVTAGRFGGHGLEPVIRGQSQNQLNIIADDAYMFGACPNRMDPPASYLSMDSYDEVIVTRGYQTVLNGPGASGGAIVLKRNTPELGEDYKMSGKVSAGYDTNSNQVSTSASALGGNSTGYIRVRASYKTANNYDDGDGDTVRSSFDERMGGFTLGMTPDDAHAYVSYDINRIDDALFPGAGMDSPMSEAQTFRAGFEKSFEKGTFRNLDASTYISNVDHVMDNYSLRTPGAMYRRVDSTSDTLGAKLKTDLAFGDQIVRTSVEFRQNNRDADRFQGMMASNVNALQSVMWPDLTANEFGLAAETTFDTSKTGRIVVGGRYDLVRVTYGRADEVAAATGLSANDVYNLFYGYGASTKTEHNFGGLLRYEHDLSDGVTLFAGLSRSVRTADATERGLANYMVMMGDNRSWVGNPNIDPEKHHQLDVGLQTAANNWDFGGSLYVDHVSDFILRDSARGQDGILLIATNADIYRNVDALLTGVEVNGSWSVTPELTLRGDATYTYGENLDEDQALAQIPPLQGTVGVTWQALQMLELGADLRWAVEQTRVDTDPTTGTGRDTGETAGYAVLDVKGTLTQFEGFTLTAGVSNLFDETYATHLNRSNISDPTEVQVNEPGRAFFLRASMEF